MKLDDRTNPKIAEKGHIFRLKEEVTKNLGLMEGEGRNERVPKCDKGGIFEVDP